MCELWIRNQDKTLLSRYNRLAVSQVTPKTQAQVMGFVGYDFGYETLGRYETKERALEVLDEIQRLLMGQDKLVISGVLDFEDAQQIKKQLDQTGVVSVFSKDDIGYISPITIVYEMPLE